MPRIWAQPISPAHRRRLARRMIAVSALFLALSAWLLSATQSPASGPFQRIALIVMAFGLLIHLVTWHWGFSLSSHIQRWPLAARRLVRRLESVGSPAVMFPLGALAVLIAPFSGGGAATVALAVAGIITLLPLFAVVLMAFLLRGSRKAG